VPESIVQAEMFAFMEWLPQSGYEHALAPEMEVYPNQAANTANSGCPSRRKVKRRCDRQLRNPVNRRGAIWTGQRSATRSQRQEILNDVLVGEPVIPPLRSGGDLRRISSAPSSIVLSVISITSNYRAGTPCAPRAARFRSLPGPHSPKLLKPQADWRFRR